MATSKPVRIRQATRADFGAIAHLLTKALIDDPIDSYLYPNRRKHPQRYYEFYHLAMKEHDSSPMTWIFCAEVDSPSQPDPEGNRPNKPQLAGIIIFGRVTTKEQREQTRTQLAKLGLAKPARRLSDFLFEIPYVSFLCDALNPITSVSRLRSFCDDEDVLDDPNYKSPDGHWVVKEVAVAPEFQRMGIGQQLVEGLQELARTDKKPIILSATPIGRKLYLKMGFKRFGVWKWGPKDARYEFDMMRWDP